MIPRFGVAPGTLTVTLDGAGNFGLVDIYSRHEHSRSGVTQPVRPMFTITPDGRAIPTAAPFMSASSWQGGEPYRSAAMDAGKVAAAVVKGPLSGAFGGIDNLDTFTSTSITIAAGLAALAGGIGGAALATPKGHRGNAAGGAAIGSLLGPVGTVVGAAVGAGEGNRWRAVGGAALGSLVFGLATYFIALKTVS